MFVDLLSIFFLITVLVHNVEADCFDIYSGRKTSFGGLLPPTCRGELDPSCRIDLNEADPSRVLPLLRAVLKSNNTVCFGCNEDNFVGVCNTIIVCSPAAQCVKKERGVMLDGTQVSRYQYGCSVNSMRCHDGTACDGNLCNGDLNSITKIENELYSSTSISTTVPSSISTTPTTLSTTSTTLSTTPTTLSTTSTTLSTTSTTLSTTPTTLSTTPTTLSTTSTTLSTTPTTLSTSPIIKSSAPSTMSTTTATTTTTTTTIPTTIKHMKPAFLACKEGNGSLTCKDERTQYFDCDVWVTDYDICIWPGSGHDIAVNRCPITCNLCTEYCQKLVSEAKQQTTISTHKPTTSPPIFCKEGNGTLTCEDQQNQYFSCGDYVTEYDICEWPRSGHDIAVNVCPVTCNFCVEYCRNKFHKM